MTDPANDLSKAFRALARRRRLQRQRERKRESERDPAHQLQDLLNETLGDAARAGDYREVVDLLDQDANPRANADYALICAAENGHTRIVERLHRHGSSVDAFDNMPLRLAAQGGRAATVQYLLESGADPSVSDHQPVWDAFCNGHADTLRLLLEAGGKLRIPAARPPPHLPQMYTPEMQQVLTDFNLWHDEDRPHGRLSRLLNAALGRADTNQNRLPPPILYPPPRR